MLDVVVITRVLTLRCPVMNYLSLFDFPVAIAVWCTSQIFSLSLSARLSPMSFLSTMVTCTVKSWAFTGIVRDSHDLDFWAYLLLSRSTLCSPVLGLSCWSVLRPATMVWYRLLSARAWANWYPFAFPSRSCWKSSSGVDAITSSINLSSISVWSNSHFIARVRTSKMKAFSVSSLRCSTQRYCFWTAVKLLCDFQWPSSFEVCVQQPWLCLSVLCIVLAIQVCCIPDSR